MRVMLYPCILCVVLVMDLFVSVWELFSETMRNVFGSGCYLFIQIYTHNLFVFSYVGSHLLIEEFEI